MIVFGAAMSYALFQIWKWRLKGKGSLSAMVTVQQICYIAAVLLVNAVWLRPESSNVSLDFLLRAPIMPTEQDILFFGFRTPAVLFLSVATSKLTGRSRPRSSRRLNIRPSPLRWSGGS